MRDVPLHAPEPQLTSTRLAPELTVMEFVLPTKLTPCLWFRKG